MSDDPAKRKYWRDRGYIPPSDLVSIKLMLHTFGQRPGETELEWRQRLADQAEACAAEADEDIEDES
jgi:hypothetical protein